MTPDYAFSNPKRAVPSQFPFPPSRRRDKVSLLCSLILLFLLLHFSDYLGRKRRRRKKRRRKRRERGICRRREELKTFPHYLSAAAATVFFTAHNFFGEISLAAVRHFLPIFAPSAPLNRYIRIRAVLYKKGLACSSSGA